MNTRSLVALAIAAWLSPVSSVSSAPVAPLARLGTDAAIRLDGDDARLQFVLFAGSDRNSYLETLNETAANVGSNGTVGYRFVRASRKVVGSGHATLRASGNGVVFTHDLTAHDKLTREVPGFVLRLDGARFAGAKWTAEADVGLIPAEPAENTRIGGGTARSLAVTFPGGRKWTLTFPKPARYEVADMRRQGGDVAFSFFCGERLNLQMGKAATAVCTLTASDGKVQPGVRDFEAIALGDTWVKLDVMPGIRPASALDFTRAPTRRTPAGADGWLTATTNGTLRFTRTPDTPVRLYGCRASDQAVFAHKQKQTAYTKQLASCGYNVVRLSRFDTRLCVEGAKGLQCDPTESGQFDQFVTGAARDGLYAFYDLSCRHPWRWSDLGIAAPGGEPPSGDLSTALCLCDARAFAAWQRLVDAIYVRKNKVGRKTYPEDAAVPLVSVISEGSAFGDWGTLQRLPFMRERYADWLAAGRKENPDSFKPEKCCDPDAFGTVSIRDAKAGSIRRFLAEADVRGVAKMCAYLRKNKSKALAGAVLGHSFYGDVAPLRATAGDFTCASFSIDSPHYLGERHALPCRIRNGNPLLLRSPVSGSVAAYERTERVMCLTSWSAPRPSAWRALSGLLVGAWAARHGWDVLLGESDPLDDPCLAAVERAVFALYARGDLTADAPADAFAIEKGDLTVKTPKTVGGFSSASDGRIVAAPLVAELKGARAAVWVSSLTDQPVASSRRLLLTHLTEMQREGALFADSHCDLLMRRGSGPHVVRNGTAAIQLAVEKPSAFKVYALATDGTRLSRLVTDVRDGLLTFTAAVRGAKNAQYVYEIVRD